MHPFIMHKRASMPKCALEKVIDDFFILLSSTRFEILLLLMLLLLFAVCHCVNFVVENR